MSIYIRKSKLYNSVTESVIDISKNEKKKSKIEISKYRIDISVFFNTCLTSITDCTTKHTKRIKLSI